MKIGMRLANTTVNDSIERWGVCIRDGSEHLWREIQAGESKFHSDEMYQSHYTLSKNENIQLPIESDDNEQVSFQWKTNETLPLQILERANRNYRGFDLYQVCQSGSVFDLPQSGTIVIGSNCRRGPGLTW